MVRYDFRHGPRLGVKPKTDHHAKQPQRIPRADLSGPIGWCMTCRHKDTPATTKATWRDPDDGKCYEVVVCAACAKHCQEVV